MLVGYASGSWVCVVVGVVYFSFMRVYVPRLVEGEGVRGRGV